MQVHKIPEATVVRLSFYARYLTELNARGKKNVLSDALADALGISSGLVRKDLNYFGAFGTRGSGYDVKQLLYYINKIIGLDQRWNVMIVGAGKIGSALALYPGFQEKNYNICAILDTDPSKIGQTLYGKTIESIDRLPEIVKEQNIHIGIISVPGKESQAVANRMVDAGIHAILNFAPTVIKVPSKVVLRNVDFSVNLKILSFNLTSAAKSLVFCFWPVFSAIASFADYAAAI